MHGSIKDLLEFAARLDATRIDYRLELARADAVMFCVAVPGERWEIEFFEDGRVEVEVFRSPGQISGVESLDVLFSDFAD